MNATSLCAHILLAAAYGLFLLGVYFMFFCPYHWRSRRKVRRGYVFMALLVASVFCLQTSLVVGSSETTGWGGVIESLSGTLQFFSLDAAYEELPEVAGEVFSGAVAKHLFLFLATVYTLLVPVMGGCFLLQLLSAFVPRLRLFFDWKRTKFVFSELNERSILLAEDIARLSWRLRYPKRGDPDAQGASGARFDLRAEGIDTAEKKWLTSACILFTDAYSDERSENSAELRVRASRIGAICLKDDVLERSISFFPLRAKKVVYFLMDGEEKNNLTSAISLVSSKRGLWKRTLRAPERKRHPLRAWVRSLFRTDRMDLYLFTKDDAAGEIVDRTYLNNCKSPDQAKVAPCDAEVRIKAINEQRNLVYNQILSDTDYFRLDPAPHKASGGLYLRRLKAGTTDKQPLRFLVFGAGGIAREFIKAAIWCGQVSAPEDALSALEIHLSVFAKNATELEQSLRCEMPFLVDETGLGGKFAKMRFHDAVFGTPKFEDCVREALADLHREEPDFILIAFGDDDMNLKAAIWLERAMDEARIGMRDGRNNAPCGIHFLIEHPEFCEALQKQLERSDRFRPYGSLQECFRLANVMMDLVERRALCAESTHLGVGSEENREKVRIHRKFAAVYNRDSSVATALHLSYKLFGLSALTYKDGHTEMKAERKPEEPFEERALRNRIYWIEHRRWCAYMGSQGYRCPSAERFVQMAFAGTGETLAFRERGQRDLEHRLHACLLDDRGTYTPIRELLLDLGRTVSESCPPGAERDALEARMRDLAAGSIELEAYKRCLRATPWGKAAERAIEAYRESEEETPLSVLLQSIFPAKAASLDDLERLSLLVTLFQPGDGETDYKQYDFEIAKSLFANLYQMRILAACEDFLACRPGRRADAVKSVRAALESYFSAYQTPSGEEHWYSESVDGRNLRVLQIAVTEPFDLLLFDCRESGLRSDQPCKRQRGGELLGFAYGGAQYLLAILRGNRSLRLQCADGARVIVQSLVAEQSGDAASSETVWGEESRTWKFREVASRKKNRRNEYEGVFAASD